MYFSCSVLSESEPDFLSYRHARNDPRHCPIARPTVRYILEIFTSQVIVCILVSKLLSNLGIRVTNRGVV